MKSIRIGLILAWVGVLLLILTACSPIVELPIEEPALVNSRVIERTSKEISSEDGGTIEITKAESIYANGFKLSIPPGALAQDNEITVGDVTGNFPPIPEGFLPAGLPISLEPKGLTFKKPVIIRVPYSDEMLEWAGVSSPDDLLLKTYDQSLGEWQDVLIKRIDYQNKVLETEIKHFSFISSFVNKIKSWFGNSRTSNPATEDEIIEYVRQTWKIAAAADDIQEHLDDKYKGIPFKDEIGGIITVLAMMNKIEDEEYRHAVQIGSEWLAWKALKEAGFGWLTPYAFLVEATWKGAVWFIKKLDEASYKKQICAYLFYRRGGSSHDEIKKDYTTDEGWVIVSNTGCGIPGYPLPEGRFKPKDALKVGKALWNAKIANVHRNEDEEEIKSAFQDVLTYNQLPTASINAPSDGSTFTQGESITFEGEATDPEDGNLIGGSLVWTSSIDGQIGIGESFTRSDLSKGTHTITLTATDSGGATGTDSVTTTVNAPTNQEPNAAFDASRTSGPTPLTVNFDASGSSDPDGNITDYAWDFGDGNTGNGETTTHTYNSEGTYDATLTVTDNDGATDQASEQITVTTGPIFQIMEFDVPSTAEVSSLITIHCAVKNNGDEEGIRVITLTIEDSVGNIVYQHTQDTALSPDGVYSREYEYVFADTGEYTVTLDTQDDQKSRTIQVSSNRSPTATINTPADNSTFTKGESINFQGEATDPEDGDLIGGSLVGTSSIDGQIGTGESFTRSDLSVGTHTITLTATDSDGATGTDSVGISVTAPEKPICSFPQKGSCKLPSGTTVIEENEITGIEKGDLYIPTDATLHLKQNAIFIWNPGYKIVTDGSITKDSGAKIKKGYLCVKYNQQDTCWSDPTFSDSPSCPAEYTRWKEVPSGTPECSEPAKMQGTLYPLALNVPIYIDGEHKATSNKEGKYSIQLTRGKHRLSIPAGDYKVKVDIGDIRGPFDFQALNIEINVPHSIMYVICLGWGKETFSIGGAGNRGFKTITVDPFVVHVPGGKNKQSFRMKIQDPSGVSKAQISVRTTNGWKNLETTLISGTPQHGTWQAKWNPPSNVGSPSVGVNSRFEIEFNDGGSDETVLFFEIYSELEGCGLQ